MVNYTEEETDQAFDMFFEIVNDTRMSGNVECVESILKEVCKNMHTEILLSYLRLTCNFSEHLKNWIPAFKTIKSELLSRGLDTKALLTGLE